MNKGILVQKHFLILFVFIYLLVGCSGGDAPKEAQAPPQNAQQVGSVKSEDKSIDDGTSKLNADVKTAVAVNNAPTIKYIAATPKFPKIGDTITVDVNAIDPDGDNFELEYVWSVNDELLAEKTNSLMLDQNFKRGDSIKLIVTPYDGKVKGDPGFMDVSIGNSPPEITSSLDPLLLRNRNFSYQVKATDPDGDPLVYALKTAPEGMTIDALGLIQWDVPAVFKGRVTVVISAKDDHEGEAVQNLVFDINP